MIFVDTVAWAAAMVPSDPHHQQVASFLSGCRDELLTSDFVIDETLTLLRARRLFDKAIDAGRKFFDLNQVRIEYLEAEDIWRAWQIFRSQPRREWSFTDCTSKVVIERFHIHQALTFDRHFLEFGNLTLVP